MNEKPRDREEQGRLGKQLGRKGKDVITGFEGTVTGIVEYLTGCRQVVLTPTTDSDGKLRAAEWFDEGRVELLGEEKVRIGFNAAPPGPDVSAPKK